MSRDGDETPDERTEAIDEPPLEGDDPPREGDEDSQVVDGSSANRAEMPSGGPSSSNPGPGPSEPPRRAASPLGGTTARAAIPGVAGPAPRLRSQLAIVRREIASLRSEKTIVLALLIQLFIAAFSSFLVVGLVSLYDPGSVDGLETEVAITGDDADALQAVAADQEALEPRRYGDRADAIAAFERREVAAVLDANRDPEGRIAVRVLAPDEGFGTTLLVVQVRKTLLQLEHDERVANVDRLEHRPLAVPAPGDAAPYFEFTYTVLLPLLLFLPVFVGGSIAVDSLIEERDRGTLELLRVAPLPLSGVIDAKLVAIAVLAPLQAVLWLLLLAFNGTVVAHPTALVVLVAALSLVVVGAALGVALYAPDRRQAQLLYSGGVVGALVVAASLPEHPANTVAKLAIGTPTATTWALLATYCAAGVAVVLGARRAVARIDTDSI